MSSAPLGLAWKDIDWQRRRSAIKQQVAHVPVRPGVKVPQLRPPKSKASDRDISISIRTTCEALIEYRRSHPAHLGGVVFHLHGVLENPNAFTTWRGRWLAKQLNIKHRHPHALRHTHVISPAFLV